VSIFYLGTHHPSWLEQTDAPLFIAHQQFAGRRTLPRARGPWALDSGGFTQLSKHGEWTIEPRTYVIAVRRYMREIGNMQWASIQDWMCERDPKHDMLKKTGLTVRDHQQRTVESLLELRAMAPDIPWLPVVQGWTLGEYLDCVELYMQHGVDLTKEPIVGIGTVCRRQATMRAGQIIRHLIDDGIRVHAFGFKLTGLAAPCGPTSPARLRPDGEEPLASARDERPDPGRVSDGIVSSDSLAWSLNARNNPPLEGHTKPGPGRPLGHLKCNNCLEYALEWRDRVLATMD